MKGKKRALEYTPGSKVAEESTAHSRALEEAQRKRMRTLRNKANRGSWFLSLPAETEDKILEILAADRNALSIMRLSMVNRGWRETVENNLQIWHTLYRYWRGPIVPSEVSKTGLQDARRMVRLNPTTPRSLPNFRHKSPSIS